MMPELEEFIEEHCKYCKNKRTNLCHIVNNISNELQCVFEEKISTTTNCE